MAHVSRGAAGDLKLRWERASEDFVYTVALSNRMEYVALGGMAKTVDIFAAESGLHLHTIALGAPVWAITLLHTPNGTLHLAMGGEFSSIKVFNVHEKREVRGRACTSSEPPTPPPRANREACYSVHRSSTCRPMRRPLTSRSLTTRSPSRMASPPPSSGNRAPTTAGMMPLPLTSCTAG